MAGLEKNKIAASVLVAGIIAMVTGFVADGLYHPETKLEKRGFSVAVSDAPAEAGEAAPAKPENILKYLSAGTVEGGQAISKKCATCHNFQKGEPNRIGPTLWNVVGKKMASNHADFPYSDAMKAKGGQWDFQTLSEFLTKPTAYVPGTKMSFAGLSKPQERADIIRYLNSLNDSPLPIPAYDASKDADAVAAASPAPATDASGKTAATGGDMKDTAAKEGDQNKTTDAKVDPAKAADAKAAGAKDSMGSDGKPVTATPAGAEATKASGAAAEKTNTPAAAADGAAAVPANDHKAKAGAEAAQAASQGGGAAAEAPPANPGQ